MKSLAKSVHFALVFSLLLALAGGSLPAQARPGGYSGTSAFRGGFSSQRMAPAKSLAANRALPQKSGPGSFGGAAAATAATAAPAKSGSASARDMEQSAAQANALKTLDARRAAAAPPVAPPADPLARPSMPMPGAAYSLPQQTIIMQQQHSGFMYGLMGFMLGRSMNTPQPAYYPPNNVPTNGNGNNGNGDNGGNGPDSAGWNDANRIGLTGGYSNAAAGMVAPAPQPSFGASVLRVLAWLLLPILLACVVHAIAKRLRRQRAAAANYSFERK